MATAYKNNIHAITRFSATYSIDKVDFLEQYRLARNVSMTSINIQKAWKASGLLPFNPQLVLKDFTLPKEAVENTLTRSYNITIRPTTPPEAVVSYSGPSGPSEAILTPATTREVQLLMDKVYRQGNQAEAEAILKKVGKSAIFAMADSVIQNRTNEELIEYNKRKENKKNRKKGNDGYARHVNQEVADKRDEDRNWDNEVKRLAKLHKDLFKAKAPRKKVLVSQRQLEILWNAEVKRLGTIHKDVFGGKAVTREDTLHQGAPRPHQL